MFKKYFSVMFFFIMFFSFCGVAMADEGGTNQQEYVGTTITAEIIDQSPGTYGRTQINPNDVTVELGGQGTGNETVTEPPRGTISSSADITPAAPEPEPDPYQQFLEQQAREDNDLLDALINATTPGSDPSGSARELINNSNRDTITLTTEEDTTQVRKNRTVLYYCWLFKNDDNTVPIIEKQTPQLYTIQAFGYSGIWTATATPWCKWDVGYYETYSMTITEASGDTRTITRQRFVKTGETEGLYPPGKSTWVISISLEDLFKDVEFPCVEIEIEAIDEETE